MSCEIVPASSVDNPALKSRERHWEDSKPK